MSQENPKVIIVAPPAISNALKENYPNWDTQNDNIRHLGDMWDALEDGTVSNESEIIIILDYEFGKTNQSRDFFAASIATLAPNALVMILDYKNIQDEIRLKVDERFASQGIEPAEYFFVRQDVAMSQIDENINYYYHKDEIIQDAQKDEPEVIKVEDEHRKSKVDTSKNGMVITCTSPKGGSGKSTVALMTATTLAQSSQKAYKQGLVEKPLSVIVVDMDVFDGQLSFVLGRIRPTALNIAVSDEVIDADLVAKNVIHHERMGIDALLAPARGQTAKVTTPKFYQKVIRILRTMYDVVILDTSVQHYDDHIKMVALPEADAILLITTLDRKSVLGMSRWMQVATTPREEGGHGVDKRKIGIVVNQSLQNVNIGKVELEAAAMHAPMSVAIPLDTLAVQSAGNANRMEELVYHQSIGPAYYKLAKKIAKVIPSQLVPIIDDTVQDTPRAVESSSRSFFGKKKG